MSDTREESQKPRTEVYRHREIFGLLSMAFGALLFLSLLTYHPSDPSWNVTGGGKTHNAAGPLGAYLSDLFLQLFGVGAYVIVFIALLFAFVMLLQRSVALRWISVLGYLCMGLFASGLLHLWFGVWQPHGYSTGGVWGQWLGTTIASKAGSIGAQILLLMCLLISIIWTTRFSFLSVFEVWWNRLSPSLHQYFLRWHETFLDWRDSLSRWKRKREEERQRQRLSRMSDHQLATAGGPDLPALNLDSSWLDQESQWAIGHAEQDTHDPEGHFPDLTPPEQKGVSYGDLIDSWEFDAEGNEVQSAKDAPQHIDAMLNIQSDTPTPIISQRAMNGSLSMPPMEIGDVPLHPEATVDLTLQTQPETQDEEGLELPSPPPPGGMGSKVNPILQRLPVEAKNAKRLDTNQADAEYVTQLSMEIENISVPEELTPHTLDQPNSGIQQDEAPESFQALAAAFVSDAPVNIPVQHTDHAPEVIESWNASKEHVHHEEETYDQPTSEWEGFRPEDYVTKETPFIRTSVAPKSHHELSTDENQTYVEELPQETPAPTYSDQPLPPIEGTSEYSTYSDVQVQAPSPQIVHQQLTASPVTQTFTETPRLHEEYITTNADIPTDFFAPAAQAGISEYTQPEQDSYSTPNAAPQHNVNHHYNEPVAQVYAQPEASSFGFQAQSPTFTEEFSAQTYTEDRQPAAYEQPHQQAYAQQIPQAAYAVQQTPQYTAQATYTEDANQTNPAEEAAYYSEPVQQQPVVQHVEPVQQQVQPVAQYVEPVQQQPIAQQVQPVAQPVIEQQPIAQHVQPVAQPVIEQQPVAQPVIEQQPVAQHIQQEPVAQHVQQQPIAPVVQHVEQQPVIQHVQQQPVAPIAQQQPVAQSVEPIVQQQPVVQEVQPVAQQIEQPVAQQVQQPVAQQVQQVAPESVHVEVVENVAPVIKRADTPAPQQFEEVVEEVKPSQPTPQQAEAIASVPEALAESNSLKKLLSRAAQQQEDEGPAPQEESALSSVNMEDEEDEYPSLEEFAQPVEAAAQVAYKSQVDNAPKQPTIHPIRKAEAVPSVMEEQAKKYAVEENDEDSEESFVPVKAQKNFQGVSKASGPVIQEKVRAKTPEVKNKAQSPHWKLHGYEAPPLDFLNYEEQGEDDDINADQLLENSNILEKTLENFGIRGQVMEILPGPVITLYEYLPEPGIKVSKIASLGDDLAMALRATRVRVIAPIPGKGVVGIEVPNKNRETVYLKEILADDSFQDTDKALPLAMGKDITGRPYVANLAKMPHLLIAGTTGSGKSVGVNSMIVSLLYNSSPDEVRLLMVDPKMLELSIYDGIPHLLLPVITEPSKASAALAWAVNEMERRYKLMAQAGVRNIGNYNNLIEKRTKAKELQRQREDALDAAQRSTLEDEFSNVSDVDMADLLADDGTDAYYEKFPFIVIVIDELADLMMVAAKEVEFSIARLAQMARAAGLHLLLATQRPSVDVLTGVIKANFPTRLAFQVKSKIDSRTIIDAPGAERLLGMGDMLLVPPGCGSPVRLHGNFVSEEEIHKIVRHLKKQGAPQYKEDILKNASGADGEDDEPVDEMYDKAYDIVVKAQNASISSLQRKLRIGYNRAARIIEYMEKEGVVGPQIGSKGREVLIPKDQA